MWHRLERWAIGLATVLVAVIWIVAQPIDFTFHTEDERA